MAIIDSVFEQEPPQLSNFWEFLIDDLESFTPRYQVVSTSLPFFQTQYQTRSTGEKVYTGVQHVDSITLELRETVEFSTYNYLKSWMDAVINEDFEFQAYEGEEDPIHRDGILTFKSFRDSGQTERLTNEVKEFIRGFNVPGTSSEDLVQALSPPISRRIEYEMLQRPGQTIQKEIIQNIFTNTARQIGTQLNRTADQVGDLARRASGGALDPPGASLPIPEVETRENRILQIPEHLRDGFRSQSIARRFQRINYDSLVRRLSTRTNSLNRPVLEEYNTKSFIFRSMKIIGWQPLNLNYTSSEPIKYSVNLAVEEVRPTE